MEAMLLLGCGGFFLEGNHLVAIEYHGAEATGFVPRHLCHSDAYVSTLIAV
jgi:hypothetical protein